MIIFITGFPGSGKTPIGKILAEELQLPFFDLDIEIEAHEGLIIKDIFSVHGEYYYRDIERKVLETFIQKQTADCVLALGGGTMTNLDNYRTILSSGIVVYLKRELDFFLENAKEITKDRPLFANIKPEDIHTEITNLLHQREQFYSLSQLQTLVDSGFSTKKLANMLKLLTNRPQRL